MDWQTTLSWQDAQVRSKILQKIRMFFSDRDVIEVETPLLSRGTITDVHLEAFTSSYHFLNDEHIKLYLQTSPEFSMKRLLACGYQSIFQICKAFRHEEFGRYHNPEFTMLEWYRIDFDHMALIKEVADLLQSVLNCDKPTQITYQEVFLQVTSIDPLNTTKAELLLFIENSNKMSDWLILENDIDILLQFIFTEIIEPTIGLDVPCFVYNFPSSQASLAKICPDDPKVAQRFECYFKGIELVNGFNELTDAKQQLLRFEEDNKKRLQDGKVEMPIDYRFIAALEDGIPDCAGVALGIDRLVMLAINANEINQVITFPIENA